MSKTKEIRKLDQKAYFSYRLTLLLYFSLLGLFSVWNLTRSSGINWSIWAIQCLPLLLLLPGILKKYYRSYSWLCFLLLFYFIKAVESTFMSTAKNSDYLFLILVGLLFISSMYSSRWLQRITKKGSTT